MTGFEPATTRPPDVDSTGLSYIPNSDANIVRIFVMIPIGAKKNVNIAYGVGFQGFEKSKKSGRGKDWRCNLFLVTLRFITWNR